MKQNYLNLKMSAIIMIALISQNVFSQCAITNTPEGELEIGSSIYPGFYGQSFTPPCDGYLEYVVFYLGSVDHIHAGTFRIYSGNTIEEEPIYTQEFPTIWVDEIGEPIVFWLTSPLEVVQDYYTFEFRAGHIKLKYNEDTYPGGNMYLNNTFYTEYDMAFRASIVDEPLTTGEFNQDLPRIFPNPASDYIAISNLHQFENYRVVNMLGKEVIKGRIGYNDKIDLRDLSTGLYFLKFENKQAIRFIKK